MTQEKQVVQTIPGIVKHEIGDVAVDGLISGVQAGILMALILILGGWLTGNDPITILSAFATGQTGFSPVAGLLVHLAVSGVYGVVFSIGLSVIPSKIARRLYPWPYLIFGVIYGAMLYFLAVTVILPNTGSALADIGLPVLIIAHLAYSISLGGLLLRQGKSKIH